ncbi:MAG: transcription elongation factor, partial [Candidatus Lokiarchaeota archaeon]|nr:transcription elongation factor [Candidatus Lokiarchaeota archaeon]
TIDVQKANKEALIKCGNCKLEARMPANYLTDPVDAYGDFIDKYYKEYA